jgi:hypothetical protein
VIVNLAALLGNLQVLCPASVQLGSAFATANAATTFLLSAQLISKPASNCQWSWSLKVSEEILWFSRFLFRRQLLKARIVADRIPHRIEPQQRRSNRKAIRYLQQPLENGNRVIGIPQ